MMSQQKLSMESCKTTSFLVQAKKARPPLAWPTDLKYGGRCQRWSHAGATKDERKVKNLTVPRHGRAGV